MLFLIVKMWAIETINPSSMYHIPARLYLSYVSHSPGAYASLHPSVSPRDLGLGGSSADIGQAAAPVSVHHLDLQRPSSVDQIPVLQLAVTLLQHLQRRLERQLPPLAHVAVQQADQEG